ncbi:MAG: hypothetical protein KAR20_11685, partial [Candidatus Heimdallarchaeota archaeon]|nr:hypothetical protein [Candidatus Heimdallarchaeota archaeon]
DDSEVHAVNVEDLIGESLSPNEYYILKDDETKTIYSWIGSSCPAKIKFFGAGKSREVRGQVGMDYSLLQVDEGDEPPELLGKFKPLFEKGESPIEKREVDNQKKTEPIQMFIIQDDDTLHEINPKNSIRESLNSTGFFILKDDGTRTIYTWIGKKCPVRKKFIGARTSQEFHGEVGFHYRLIHVDEGEEPTELLEKIKGNT